MSPLRIGRRLAGGFVKLPPPDEVRIVVQGDGAHGVRSQQRQAARGRGNQDSGQDKIRRSFSQNAPGVNRQSRHVATKHSAADDCVQTSRENWENHLFRQAPFVKTRIGFVAAISGGIAANMTRVKTAMVLVWVVSCFLLSLGLLQLHHRLGKGLADRRHDLGGTEIMVAPVGDAPSGVSIPPA